VSLEEQLIGAVKLVFEEVISYLKKKKKIHLISLDELGGLLDPGGVNYMFSIKPKGNSFPQNKCQG